MISIAKSIPCIIDLCAPPPADHFVCRAFLYHLILDRLKIHNFSWIIKFICMGDEFVFDVVRHQTVCSRLDTEPNPDTADDSFTYKRSKEFEWKTFCCLAHLLNITNTRCGLKLVNLKPIKPFEEIIYILLWSFVGRKVAWAQPYYGFILYLGQVLMELQFR